MQDYKRIGGEVMAKLYIAILVLISLLFVSVSVNYWALKDLGVCQDRLTTELDREW